MGHAFLDYSVLASTPKDGQHYGIIAVELGVGIAVAAVMVAIYYSFASRPPRLDDEDW
jgi:multicomponent Na+:H+ antiporter subunit B